jgi:hypothetical protein
VGGSGRQQDEGIGYQTEAVDALGATMRQDTVAHLVPHFHNAFWGIWVCLAVSTVFPSRIHSDELPRVMPCFSFDLSPHTIYRRPRLVLLD